MRKILLAALALTLCLSFAACGNEEKQDAPEPQSTDTAANQEAPAKPEGTMPAAQDSDSQTPTSGEITYADQIEFDGFTVVFSPDYSFDKVNNQYSDLNGAEVVVFAVTITNNNSETGMINPFYISLFGSLGKELKDCSAYFDNDLMFNIGDLRSGATTEATIHALYDGDGDYYIELDNYSEKIEIKLPVVKQ